METAAEADECGGVEGGAGGAVQETAGGGGEGQEGESVGVKMLSYYFIEHADRRAKCHLSRKINSRVDI